jgi:hypothetical protein
MAMANRNIISYYQISMASKKNDGAQRQREKRNISGGAAKYLASTAGNAQRSSAGSLSGNWHQQSNKASAAK